LQLLLVHFRWGSMAGIKGCAADIPSRPHTCICAQDLVNSQLQGSIPTGSTPARVMTARQQLGHPADGAAATRYAWLTSQQLPLMGSSTQGRVLHPQQGQHQATSTKHAINSPGVCVNHRGLLQPHINTYYCRKRPAYSESCFFVTKNPAQMTQTTLRMLQPQQRLSSRLLATQPSVATTSTPTTVGLGGAQATYRSRASIQGWLPCLTPTQMQLVALHMPPHANAGTPHGMIDTNNHYQFRHNHY